MEMILEMFLYKNIYELKMVMVVGGAGPSNSAFPQLLLFGFSYLSD